MIHGSGKSVTETSEKSIGGNSAFFSGFGNLPSLNKYIFSGGLSNGKTVFYGTGRKNTDS